MDLIPYWLLPDPVRVADWMLGLRILRAVEHAAQESADEDLPL